jgi:hypothetical protein
MLIWWQSNVSGCLGTYPEASLPTGAAKGPKTLPQLSSSSGSQSMADEWGIQKSFSFAWKKDKSWDFIYTPGTFHVIRLSQGHHLKSYSCLDSFFSLSYFTQSLLSSPKSSEIKNLILIVILRMIFFYLLVHYGCTWSALWHLQKCLQYNLVRFTPSFSFIPLPYFLEQFWQTSLFHFQTCTFYFHHICPPLPFMNIVEKIN